MGVKESCVPPSDVRPEIVAALDPNAALRLLEDVEQLPEDATGALVFGSPDEPAGMVLVERRMVCWAVAAGMRRRLTDLLCHQCTPPLEPSTVEEVYRRCAATGRILGEELVASGLVSADGLRRALRQHTGEAITLLSRLRRVDVSPAWIAHRRCRYDARFTFSPSELLVGIASLRLQTLADTAHADLASTLDAGGGGAAFSRRAGLALPLPFTTYRASMFRVRDLVELGRWAMDTLDLAAAVDEERRLVTASIPDGATLLAWQDGYSVMAALCPDRASFARALLRRVRVTSSKQAGQ